MTQQPVTTCQPPAENGTHPVSRINGKKSPPSLSVKEVDEKTGVVTDFVDLQKLPEFQILNQRVSAVVQSSSWWERYGVDMFILLGAVAGLYLSYFCLASSDGIVFAAGIILLGLCHTLISVKSGHNAVHGSLCSSPFLNKYLGYFCSDFVGSFSSDAGYDIHIKCHHPHTNIIGLGDSSTFRAPFVPNFLYMFVTPLLSPFLIPLVSVREMYTKSAVKIVRHVIVAYGGFAFHLYLLTTVSQLTIWSALLVCFLSRNILSIPYIHVNIFQHIGLPMYSQQYRPKKVYQMTTGVLNLPRNFVLDYCFGHGIISCHVEHHLFPKLSDNMCLKVKSVVENFCKEYDLPYHYDTYINRTKAFLFDYQRLMVNAPPVTKFVGLQ
ncbi:fatty acid desaturase 6 [Aplysia californica]|uniref:Fatty acid desaturase 6 n=1 Tax=Aplysia californica TaxID=6500 RepID=A0ABM0JV65_APLCA|nr:fatty acid desaturase 6 [Aplysia californica]XP_005102266.1 fatty acid desaturase 6 [Aplysia californica]XP_005102267.1 fatty acid desaturase 6 [Aplysia californica]